MSKKSSSAIALAKMQRGQFSISPEQPVYSAVYAYLAYEFANARCYEAGILHDQDPEFLHQYRVCLRRSRAIISLVKALLPEKQQKCLSVLLKELMQKTNLLRDLDVYLQKKDSFFMQLADKHHKGLEAFFADIEQRRAEQLKEVCDWLRGNSYQQRCREIQIQLQAIQVAVPPSRAKKSCAGYGRKAVWKRFKKVSARAGKIAAHSVDSKIHKLRIDCKKLRYLLEYFAPLFKADAYWHELKSLKKLQDYLGDFNDSAVQHDFLSCYLADLADKGDRGSAEAVRKLKHSSEKLHQQARAHILQQLQYFLLAQTKQNYRTLCESAVRKSG